MEDHTGRFVSLIGIYRVDPRDEQAFADIAYESIARTERKPECLYYQFSKDLREPGLFYLAEAWTE